MIMIYSVDSDGRLFTDPKQHFYIDADLLRERAAIRKEQAILDRIAAILGWPDFDSLDTYGRCSGIAPDTLMDWIRTGTVASNLGRRPDA